MAIDEHEFHRVLALFPVVRRRDYCADEDSAGQSTSWSTENKGPERLDGQEKESSSRRNDFHAAFWDKLKASAEKKLGSTDAEQFCEAFQQVYRRLVYEELNLEAAQSFIKSLGKTQN